jgi:hypothetical protein
MNDIKTVIDSSAHIFFSTVGRMAQAGDVGQAQGLKLISRPS